MYSLEQEYVATIHFSCWYMSQYDLKAQSKVMGYNMHK